MRIATLGPIGTFSNEAALTYNPKATIVFKDTIWHVFESVRSLDTDTGIVPIENSISGSVGLTLDALMDFDIQITSELILPIRHSLAGIGPMTKIRKLFAHPQSYAQCVSFIRQKLHDVEMIPMVSNARAAEELSKMKSNQYGAIVPELAIKKYKLNSLKKSIQDSKFNVTRFLVLDGPKSKSKKSRTSIAIYPHLDRPGLLYELIGEFAKRNINLTKIESRPSKGRLGDYVFFIDLQGDSEDKKISKALTEIKNNFFLKILGSYPAMY